MKVTETIRQTILFAVTRPLLHMALSRDEKKNYSNQSTPPFLDSLFLHSSTRLWVAGMDRMLQPRDYSNNSIVFTPEIICSSVWWDGGLGAN